MLFTRHLLRYHYQRDNHKRLPKAYSSEYLGYSKTFLRKYVAGLFKLVQKRLFRLKKKTNECKNCHMKWLSVLQGTLPHSLVTACLCSSRRLWLNSHVGDSTIMELKRYWSMEIINEMKKTKRQVDGAASVIPATCVNMIPRTIASWVRTPNAFD